MRIIRSSRRFFFALVCFGVFLIGDLYASTQVIPEYNEKLNKQPITSTGELTTADHDKKWYFSWGYNSDSWTRSDIHISEPSLHNNFTIHNVSASDDPGWTTGIFNKDLTVPQFNIRIGRFINAAHTLAIEFSLDHTKYNTNLNQLAQVTGTIDGKPVNKKEVLSSNYFDYKLHNGANHIMLSLALFKPLFNIKDTDLALSFVGKLGVGIMFPHAENTVLGNKSDVGKKELSNVFGWWQFGGWTAGEEVGFRLALYKPVYLEFTNKEAYTSLSNIPVYEGRANQTLWLNETIVSLGVMI